ncbi:MAG: PsbP-related protein [Candidatus Ornithomonoglobus sp.]
MKKSTICSLAAASLLITAISGCGPIFDSADEATAEPVRVDPTINVFGAYAPIEGYTEYTSADGSFSIQLPDGSMIDDSNPDSVTVTVASGYENPDLINISKSDSAQRLTSTAELMKMLESDNSIDITGYANINKDGAYEGYKYTYTAMDNETLKGIVSTYFSEDGTAYIVNATINNGADEENVTMINTIVDTFINNR